MEFCAAKERGKAVQDVDDDAEETIEEVEGFDDFTIASTWERFISEIEAVCRLWLVDGPKNLLDKGSECLSSRRNMYRIKCELKHGTKLYGMEYNFQIHSNDKIDLWDDDVQNLQLSFGVIEFLVIAPISASGVVLDAPEASKLLSAVAIALSNCGSNWPAFVPVHDPSRKAYIGIQNKCTTFTRRFDSDRISSQVPIRLLHLEGLYELFVSKFALTAVDFSTNCFNVCSTMRLTYRTPCTDLDIESQDHINHESIGGAAENIRTQWDDNCPWAKWYSAEDPVKGFELTAIWRTKMFEGSVEMAELENESPFDAETWLLLPIISQNMIDDSICKFGFFSQLKFLVGAFERSFEAKYVEDFVSAENSVPDISKSSDSIPPPTVVDRILKDLFHDEVESASSIEFGSSSRFIKGAPLGSLFAQFCLHLLWLGNCNIRAIATMWIEFVREVRWCWEESQPLPKMPTSCNIDLSACLVHQKLQMLSICIEKKNLLIHERHSGIENEAASSGVKKVDLYHLSDHSRMVSKESLGDSSSQRLVVRHDSEDSLACSSTLGHGTKSGVLQPTNENRRGSEGIVESMMLLHSFQNMHAPRIQDAPLLTEDMHEERLRVAEAFGNVLSFSGQLERDILSSDMSAFKAANPDAIFEDFIRWHSPGDWEDDEVGDESIHGMVEFLNSSWPPKGRLSQRMAEHGSLWRKIWDASPALAASEQRPLLDPTREGEKILHYLETLKPNQLLEQIVCTAFRASADTLSRTKFGDFRLLKVKIDQLYRTLASTLKLLANLEKDEPIRDLKQLCVLFEHIEKLIILAASVHLKLSDAPRLSHAIFQEYFNFYLPKLGTGSKNLSYDKDFNLKQPVKAHERDVIANFFPPPSASQSWRKVLSMGNLLFGHEPTLREIIFSVRDDVSHAHGQYSSRAPMGDIETHRMYICGTSNDLRVALSVTSWD